MRLIDADRFEDQMNEELLPKLIKEYGKEEALKGLHFSFRDCICNIQAQPTVEEQKKTGCKCCKYWTLSNYCPNCGAKLVGRYMGEEE